MDNIIPFPKKNDEERARYYSFSVNFENYLLICFENKNEVSYAKASFTEDGDIQPVTIPMDEVKTLFDLTYPTFFLNVSNDKENTTNERYVALLYFDYEEEQYGLYYHEDYDDLPLLLFHIKDEKVHKVDNPFQVKRIIKYVEETFEIEWL